MKYGVIDIGSNSVRLMISDGKTTLYKMVKTTRLAEGMGENSLLTDIAIERTALAIKDLKSVAESENVISLWVFATAAVRQAINRQIFIDKVKELCGLTVEVVSGETEAKLGVMGALSGKIGGIIDVGGASSEIAVFDGREIAYSKSIKLGAVSLTDECGQDKEKAKRFVLNKIEEYGNVPNTDYYAIGGTATSIASVLQQLEPYDPNKVDGYKVYKKELYNLTERFYSLSVEDRKKLKGLQPERAKVIANGAIILLEIMQKIGLEYFTVSEKDNLEGYLITKLEK